MENRKILIQLIKTLKSRVYKVMPYLAIILLAALARIVPHPPNFAPVGGLALFTGYHFKSKFAWLIPISVMVLSDFVIGFHSTVPYVYLSFIIISLIGSRLKQSKFAYLFGASFVSSILFFIITNFGSWATGTMYSKNVEGLAQSYLMGLPFFRNTLLSDLIYTFSFFRVFSLLYVFVNKRAVRKAPVNLVG